MNGNTTVLAGKQAIRAAAIIGCPIEVNIYYRTPERMEKLITALESMKEEVAVEVDEKTKASVMAVEILGDDADGKIEGLEGPRSICSRKGIESADVVLVPLEDGDRCEALVALGKQVLVIDLNPLSRTARTATVTIVDEVARALGEMEELLLQNPQPTDWDNQKTLREALEIISDSSKRI
jgi:4-phosphopantoate--beta-alanine ligase